MTKNNEAVVSDGRHRNGYNINPLTRIYWRASLVPAAAVIPAPEVYANIAAVKKLVAGSAVLGVGSPQGILTTLARIASPLSMLFAERRRLLARLL